MFPMHHWVFPSSNSTRFPTVAAKSANWPSGGQWCLGWGQLHWSLHHVFAVPFGCSSGVPRWCESQWGRGFEVSCPAAKRLLGNFCSVERVCDEGLGLPAAYFWVEIWWGFVRQWSFAVGLPNIGLLYLQAVKCLLLLDSDDDDDDDDDGDDDDDHDHDHDYNDDNDGGVSGWVL